MLGIGYMNNDIIGPFQNTFTFDEWLYNINLNNLLNLKIKMAGEDSHKI